MKFVGLAMNDLGIKKRESLSNKRIKTHLALNTLPLVFQKRQQLKGSKHRR